MQITETAISPVVYYIIIYKCMQNRKWFERLGNKQMFGT